VIPQSWAPDGQHIVVTNVQPDHPNYVALMATTAPHSIQRFQTGETRRRWDRSRRTVMDDVRLGRVRPPRGLRAAVPWSRPALQISTAGGDEPCWAGRGLELVFRRGEALFSVT
jgi:hypothetical protein